MHPTRPRPRLLRSAPACAVLLFASLFLTSPALRAAPPAPSGAHPRIFLSDAVRTAFDAAKGNSKSAVAALIKRCTDATANPNSINASGYQGDAWSLTASACALAWQVTGDAAHAATGLKLWRALLEDIDTIGDKKACVAGAATMAATASIRRDTGYAIRFIGPHTALVYDWMHDAPGVTETLRAQTRACFNQWITYYTNSGYLNDVPGANYHAGYVAAKTLISIAQSGDAGADGDRIWTEAVDEVFAQQMVANGVAADNGGVSKGGYHGALLGGDWAEGWQYGPLSVVEYSMATRALQEQGVDLAAMGGWAGDLTLREIYSLLPDKKQMYVGGDIDDGEHFFTTPKSSPFDATLIGPASAQATSWAAFMLNQLFPGSARESVWQAIADARGAIAADPLDPPLPLWFLAKGTRNLYVRSDWTGSAYWAVFTSAPRMVPDHQHGDATNFVFVRGPDQLVVDPSPYGSRSTLSGNALTIDSTVVKGDYAPSQTLWSQADMPLVRGTASGVVAARGDFAKAFKFDDTPSDITFARRDWVFLPEGEVVIIDRATTPSASHKLYLRFRTPGKLTAVTESPFVARAEVGGSSLAIHTVALRPNIAPVMRAAPVGNDCGEGPFGVCRIARMAVDEYVWEPAGPDVMAIHVLDGVASGEAPADVAPVDAAPIDTSPAQNAGVMGASVYRAQKQTFVLEPATLPAAATITYGVPGANPSRHVFFDAPADASGKTAVTATASGDRCLVTLTAGAGVTSGPAIFTLSPASDGCKVSEDANVAPGTVSPGTGGFDRPGGGGPGAGDGSGSTDGGVTGGCGCCVQSGGAAGAWAAAAALGVAVAVAARARRRRRGG